MTKRDIEQTQRRIENVYGSSCNAGKPIIKFTNTTKNDFYSIANSIADVLTKKNELYGNSALNPIAVFSGKTKVGQRADDKVSRIQNSPTLRKNDVADLIGYLVLMCKENNWTDFSDQID